MYIAGDDMIDSVENKNTKGIICIIASAFFFSLMFLFIRMSGYIPTLQKCFFRNAIAMVIALATILRSGQGFSIGEGNFKYLFLRAFGGTIGLICNFYAIDKLSISDASMLNKLSPFFAIVFSYFVLKEKADRFEWTAVFIAFIGALFVVKPTFSMEVIPALVAVIGGCGAGFAYTFVRKLGMRGERSMMVVLFFSTFSTLVTLPYVIFNYTPMTLTQFTYLILCGIAAAGGQIFITKAYSYAPAKEISVYDFSIVIFTAIWGFIFIDQIPDYLSIIGYVIIIGISIVKWRYTINKSKLN